MTHVAHAPAMRVGGRRLSLNSSTTRPRVRTTSTSEPVEPGVTTHDPPADYPRPNVNPSSAEPEDHRHEEDVPKREKRQGHNNFERELKMRESANRKVEMNRPNKSGGGFDGKDNARRGRIAQPAGKGMAI